MYLLRYGSFVCERSICFNVISSWWLLENGNSWWPRGINRQLHHRESGTCLILTLFIFINDWFNRLYKQTKRRSYVTVCLRRIKPNGLCRMKEFSGLFTRRLCVVIAAQCERSYTVSFWALLYIYYCFRKLLQYSYAPKWIRIVNQWPAGGAYKE